MLLRTLVEMLSFLRQKKKVREKSRECHNHNRSPSETPRDKTKQAQIEQTYEKH